MTREGARPARRGSTYVGKRESAMGIYRGGGRSLVPDRNARFRPARVSFTPCGVPWEAPETRAAWANRSHSTHRHERRPAIRRVRGAILPRRVAPSRPVVGGRSCGGGNSPFWPGFVCRGALRSVNERRAHHPVAFAGTSSRSSGRYAPLARDRRRAALGELLHREPRARGRDGGGAPPGARRERGAPQAIAVPRRSRATG